MSPCTEGSTALHNGCRCACIINNSCFFLTWRFPNSQRLGLRFHTAAFEPPSALVDAFSRRFLIPRRRCRICFETRARSPSVFFLGLGRKAISRFNPALYCNLGFHFSRADLGLGHNWDCTDFHYSSCPTGTRPGRASPCTVFASKKALSTGNLV